MRKHNSCPRNVVSLIAKPRTALAGLAALAAFVLACHLYVAQASAQEPQVEITSLGYTHLYDDIYLVEGTLTGDPYEVYRVELGGIFEGFDATVYIDGTFDVTLSIPEGSHGDGTAQAELYDGTLSNVASTDVST